MQHFTGTEYVMIDIANNFGLDRLNWDDRLWWVKDNRPDLDKLADNAASPFAFRKAVHALKQAEKGEPTNHTMGLDATASGIQIMAAMSADSKAGETVNIVNSGRRRDLYTEVAQTMSEYASREITRDDLKKPIMTYFYGSEAVPKAAFADKEALEAFYRTLQERLEGPYKLRNLFLKFWDPTACNYEWAMPDGHFAYIPVLQMEERGVEIDEADHFRYTMRKQVCKPKDIGLALAANIVHAVDAWICRNMVKRAKEAGFHLVPIHDCFFAHPNYMNQVRQFYVDIMAELASMNMVSNILTQLIGKKYHYNKLDADLTDSIKQSEYALS
jgi:DNA-directed RNA polymerase